jgi:hypothetical protein
VAKETLIGNTCGESAKGLIAPCPPCYNNNFTYFPFEMCYKLLMMAYDSAALAISSKAKSFISSELTISLALLRLSLLNSRVMMIFHYDIPLSRVVFDYFFDV